MQVPSNVGFTFQFSAKWGLLRKDNRISLDGTFIFDGKRHLCFLERHCHFQETPFILLPAWFTRCWDQSKDQIRSSEHATIILTVQKLEQCSACRVPPRFSSRASRTEKLRLKDLSSLLPRQIRSLAKFRALCSWTISSGMVLIFFGKLCTVSAHLLDNIHDSK